MKNLILGILVGSWLISCNETESVRNEFTGNETVYALDQGSAYNVSGRCYHKRESGWHSISRGEFVGNRRGYRTSSASSYGKYFSSGADVAALLNPVAGKTGRSETHLTQLADESLISYGELINLNACIKVHLASSGPDRDIILAGGNIGKASTPDVTGGRIGIGVCKSE